MASFHKCAQICRLFSAEERKCSDSQGSSAFKQTRETKVERLQEHSEEPARPTKDGPQVFGETNIQRWNKLCYHITEFEL